MIDSSQAQQIESNLAAILNRFTNVNVSSFECSPDSKEITALNSNGSRIPVCTFPSFPYDSFNASNAAFLTGAYTDMKYLVTVCDYLLKQYSHVEECLMDCLHTQKLEYETSNEMSKMIGEVYKKSEDLRTVVQKTNSNVHAKLNKFSQK